MTRSARFAGWAAVAGMVVGLAITPFMAAVWAYEPGIVWEDVSLLGRLVGPTLESWGALSFGSALTLAWDGSVASEGTAYKVYGKVFFLVYLLMLPIVRHVHNLQKGSAPSKWVRRTWRALWVGLVVATWGDAVSYWGVSFPGGFGLTLWRGGFVVEIVAMLVVLPSITVYGILSMRLRVIPLWSSILIALTIPIGVVTLLTITSYVPNAIVVPMSMIWAAIGVWVLTSAKGTSTT
jgi:hypothetical protein